MNAVITARLPFWNQGQGGNISVKAQPVMAIKPTGFRLDQLHDLKDFATLDYVDLEGRLMALAKSGESSIFCENKYSELIAEAKEKMKSQHRASMEVGFHIFLPATYVCHIHHLNSLFLTELLDRSEADEFLKEWSSEITVVPYIRPGWELTKYFIEHPLRTPIILMRNHGVIIQVNDLNGFKHFEKFSKELEGFLSKKMSRDMQVFEQDFIKGKWEAPLKFFFPDIAIFEDKLKSFLSFDGHNFVLDKAQEIPRDMFENWLAIVYLHKLMPQLTTLPASEVQELKTTPTEVARLREISKGIKP